MNTIELTDREFLKLKSCNIYIKTYGEDIGKYYGKITFSNENQDEFTFNIGDEDMKDFIKLISKQVSKTAETFTHKLKRLFGII